MTTPDANRQMPDQTRCPQCGAPLVPGALAGLCPACLLKQGATADTLTGAPGAPPAHGFESPSVAELAPLFPQLEIIELIGKGGMGAVYKARQKELDRIVALKILPPGMDHAPGFAERFAREAKALAKLNHPGIVTIHEFGRAEGLFYFVMEFVDGVNLRQLVAGGRVSAREALAIVPEICDALQFAHDHGIVHRDIKPANILLDRRGRVKVADFGLAKLVEAGMEAGAAEQQSAADAGLTEAGKVMGTPSYMAPEQTDRPDEVDHRADIYSLGVVLYELLTGELPDSKLQLPSRKVQIDVRLDEVVMRALEKKPDLRYQQASHVKAAVETISGTASSAKGSNDEVPAQKTVVAREYSLDILSCLRRAWTLVRSDFWPLVGITALILALLGVAGAAGNSSSDRNTSHAASVLFLLLNGPLMGGLYLYFLKKIRGEPSTVETAFSGFSNRFLHLFLGGFVTFTLTGLGFLCLILPGIYLLVAWIFTLPLIIDKRLHFWSAMELSRKTVSRHWFQFLLFGIVLSLLSMAGLLALIIGFFIVAPIAVAALMYAYEDIFVADGAVETVVGNEAPGFVQGSTADKPVGESFGATLFSRVRSAPKPVTISAAILVAALLIWSAAPRHHSQNRQADKQKPGFGLVTERLVDHEKMAQGVGLDLESGSVFSASEWTLKPVAEQFRGQHADIYFDPGTREWRALDMSATSWNGQTLDLSPEQVTRIHWRPFRGTARLDLFPVTYLIRTREGGMGILQVAGNADDPSEAKIRYKLLQHSPKNIAGQVPKPGQHEDESSNLIAAAGIPMAVHGDTVTFGPAIERVVNDVDAKRGKECLAIESGELFDLNKTQLDALPKAEQQKWFSDHQVNVLMNTVDGRRGLGIRDATLTMLPTKAWDQQGAAGIEKAIHAENPGIEYKDAGGFRWHILSAGAHLPVTFALRTGSGRAGLLQVMSFRDNPGSVRLRYKLVQKPSVAPPPPLLEN
jgi:predicted Ser/Thr protein kinase